MLKAKYVAKAPSHLHCLQELEEENLPPKEIFAGLSLEFRVLNDVIERKPDSDD